MKEDTKTIRIRYRKPKVLSVRENKVPVIQCVRCRRILPIRPRKRGEDEG